MMKCLCCFFEGIYMLDFRVDLEFVKGRADLALRGPMPALFSKTYPSGVLKNLSHVFTSVVDNLIAG